jgi:preprotein translocase subunit SecA
MKSLTPLQSLWQWMHPQSSAVKAADWRAVEMIHEHAARYRRASDRQLPGYLEALRQQVRVGHDAGNHEILLPIFALVCEAVRRVVGLRLYDVQLLGGLALARGAIAEMGTGEGKTLAAALPALAFSLSGRGVHVVTPNGYLAQRDHQLLQPVFALLGISTGLLRENAPAEKQAAYACDITYGTGYEFGFDYLRDQLQTMRRPPPSLGEAFRRQLQGHRQSPPVALQRGHAAAIVDEIDSVLLDEACLPLVLSDLPETDPPDALAYQAADRLCGQLCEGEDFVLDERSRTVTLTQQGLSRSEAAGTTAGLSLRRPWTVYVRQSLHAHRTHRRDVDYVVRDGKVQMVDEFTGRIHPDRYWRDGMQQALEVKEQLSLSPELATAARISRQRYFRLYHTLCGMTGTAAGNERELWTLYRMPVVVVPPQRPSRRTVLPTRFFTDAASKWQAVVAAVRALHRTTRPVLIGSRTIENSELLSRLLAAEGTTHLLLNGKQDRNEAEIVARAGQPGAVTVATNMAGRGTDIALGPGVAERGGLHVLGVELHESARIDRQLLGRAGRQGDPGSGQFYVSADDALLVRFAPALRCSMQALPHDDGEIRSDLSPAIAAVQKKAEQAGRQQRRLLLAHDHWLDDWLSTLVKADD